MLPASLRNFLGGSTTPPDKPAPTRGKSARKHERMVAEIKAKQKAAQEAAAAEAMKKAGGPSRAESSTARRPTEHDEQIPVNLHEGANTAAGSGYLSLAGYSLSSLNPMNYFFPAKLGLAQPKPDLALPKPLTTESKSVSFQLPAEQGPSSGGKGSASAKQTSPQDVPQSIPSPILPAQVDSGLSSSPGSFDSGGRPKLTTGVEAGPPSMRKEKRWRSNTMPDPSAGASGTADKTSRRASQPPPPSGWSLDPIKPRSFKDLPPAAQEKYEAFRGYVMEGYHPKVAAERVGDTKYTMLRGNPKVDMAEIRISGGHRVTFNVDKSEKQIRILDVGGHT